MDLVTEDGKFAEAWPGLGLTAGQFRLESRMCLLPQALGHVTTSLGKGSVYGAPSAHSGHGPAGHVRLGTVLAG